MQTITSARGCDEEGDYIAWSKSVWTVHGAASIETKKETQLCQEKSNFIFFSALFPEMSLCMQHCEKLKSVSPSVIAREDWLAVKSFLGRKLYSKGQSQVWLSLTDEEVEDVLKVEEVPDLAVEALDRGGGGNL